MIKFVVWGIGDNGKFLCNFLHKESIVAIIDQYSLLDNYNGIKVIRYEEYKEKYREYPIFISMEKYNQVLELLSSDEISDYYLYWENRFDLVKIICQMNQEKFIKKYIKNNKVNISLNEFSGIILYNILEHYGLANCSDIENDKLLLNSDYEGEPKELDFSAVLNDDYLFEHEELKRFKNIHYGERCFIVATGPSLKISDLDKLKKNKEICISVNGIFKCFDMTEWRPDYYIVSDINATVQWCKEIVDMDVKTKFVSDLSFHTGFHKYNDLYKWHLNSIKHTGTEPQFTDDFSKVSYNGDTITYDGALQLAVYMGFKEIYLLGTDCCQPKTGESHFVKNYHDEEYKNAVQHTDLQKMSYRAARKYAEKHDIKIYNATRGGELEVFERVDFDSIL